MFQILSAFTSIATTLGVAVAAWQLWLVHKQSVTSFEDSITKEYRELAAKLPTKALLGETLTDEEYAECFDEFYRYFDLCNEQAFLHKNGRISKATWQFWNDGIAFNLRRPAFRRAWSEVAKRSDGDFSELRTLSPPLDHDQ